MPPFLDVGGDLCVRDLGFRRVARFQRTLFLTLADKRAERIRNALAMLINPSDRVTKRANHNKDHMCRRCDQSAA
jgi:hypothetical protein